MGEDRQAGQGRQEQERSGRRCWTSRAGRNGHGLGRPAWRGRRHGNQKVSVSVYVSLVCVVVQELLQGEVGSKDRGWNNRIVQSISGCRTSDTAGTGACNPPCTEFPRPIWTWAYSRKVNSKSAFMRVILLGIRWWLRRRQVHIAAALPSSVGIRNTSWLKRSRSTEQTLPAYSWRRDTSRGISWGATWPQTTPQP